MQKIGDALSFQKRKEDIDMDIAETCNLQPFKEEHRNAHHEGGNEGNNSEEEEEDGHQKGGVRCQ